jgi:hypothetical protein
MHQLSHVNLTFAFSLSQGRGNTRDAMASGGAGKIALRFGEQGLSCGFPQWFFAGVVTTIASVRWEY